MTATLIAHIDDTYKLKSILSLFKRLQIPFKSLSNDLLITDDSEAPEDWTELTQTMLENDPDWNSSYDDHWGELYLKTKNLEPI